MNISEQQLETLQEKPPLQESIELSESPNAPRNQLRDAKTQLANNFAQQKKQSDENAQALELILNEVQKLEETISKKDEQLLTLEEQIRILQQEKDSLANKNNELLLTLEEKTQILQQEKTLWENKSKEFEKFETTVKDQMEAYEAQIKDLKEKTQLNQEKRYESSPIKVGKRETSDVKLKHTSFGSSYYQRLETAIGHLRQLQNFNSEWLEFSQKQQMLRISPGRHWKEVTSQHLKDISKGLKKILKEDKVLLLKGVELDFRNLDENAASAEKLIEVLGLISSRSINFHNINLLFMGCQDFTDKVFVKVEKIISKQSPYLQGVELRFNACTKLTKKTFTSVAEAIINHLGGLQSLCLGFSGLDNFTYKNAELIAEAIVESCKNLQELSFYVGTIFKDQCKYDQDVSEKNFKERFEHIKDVYLNYGFSGFHL